MKMTGEQRIAAPRERVWEALNDPDVLRACIPGCQSLERESEHRMRATIEIKIGPIGARFAGAVTLSDIDPANGYTISGEGQGGMAGFAKGGAKVRLTDDGAGTLLAYDVDVDVGGRLAQLGGPIIDATARQLAGKFFDKFGSVVGGAAAPVADTPRAVPAGGPAPAVPAAVAAPAARSSVAPAAAGLPVAWLLGLGVAALAGFLIGRGQGAAPGSDWVGLSIGLLVVIVAAAAFEFGRRAGATVLIVEPGRLASLVEGARS